MQKISQALRAHKSPHNLNTATLMLATWYLQTAVLCRKLYNQVVNYNYPRDYTSNQVRLFPSVKS